MKKKVSGVTLTLLLIGMFTLTFNVRTVKASGTIYIRADGSIEGTDKVHKEGDLYTFIDNINSDANGIVIERNNMTLDGAGYTLQGTGVYPSIGIDLSGRKNVTIMNMQIRVFYYGIYLHESSNNTIVRNNLTNNAYGLNQEEWEEKCPTYNSIVGNNITENNYYGIVIMNSWNNTISGNNLTNNGDGIGIAGYSSYNNIVGNNIKDNNVGVGLFEPPRYNNIVRNYIANNNLGIWSHESIFCNISENIIANNNFGINLDLCWHDHIYHNNFINNKVKQVVTGGIIEQVNIWDDGYPSGGNYWTDYNGTDLYGGPFQNETGSDRIGDTPYIISIYNTDYYPLMNPWIDTTPPSISILSPQNTTYTTSSIPLTFTVNEPTSWIGYSLDGQTNVTISGNTMLTGLIEGLHNIIVYVSDTSRNIGASKVFFTVQMPPPRYTLTIGSMPTGVTFTVDSVSHTTPWSGTYDKSTSVSLETPEVHGIGDATYYWSQWNDGVTSRSRTVTMNTNITLTAHYTGPYYELTVASSPITGITFIINGVPKTTPYTEWLLEGSYTLQIPKTYNGYVWSHWLEDGDTNRTKTIILSGTTWTGIFVQAKPPPVGGYSIAIDGYAAANPLAHYLALIAILTIGFATIKRKTIRKTK